MYYLLYYLAIGIISGFFSGLFGIGGGLLVVPMLAVVLPVLGYTEHVMQFATATSLAVMIFTAATSTLSHHNRRSVDWGIVKIFALTVILGSVVGRYFAHIIPSVLLKLLFIISLYAIALSVVVELYRNHKNATIHHWSCSSSALVVVGLFIGVIAGMLGIGGGLLIVPYLLRCGSKMVQAVGTAAACGLIVATTGTISSIFFGWHVTNPYCIGYIVLPAAICIAVTGIPAATLGAYLAYNVHDKRLKIIFALFLVLIASTLLSPYVQSAKIL